MLINTYCEKGDDNGIEYIKRPDLGTPFPGKMYFQRINRMGNRIDLEPKQLMVIDKTDLSGKHVLEEQLNR